MLVYSKRKQLARLYEKWITEHTIKDCVENMIMFLLVNDLINIEYALKFIEKENEGND